MDHPQVLVNKEIQVMLLHFPQLHQQVVAQVVGGVPHQDLMDYLVVQVVVLLKMELWVQEIHLLSPLLKERMVV